MRFLRCDHSSLALPRRTVETFSAYKKENVISRTASSIPDRKPAGSPAVSFLTKGRKLYLPRHRHFHTQKRWKTSPQTH